MMLRTTSREAKEIYRDRLRIAALGAVDPKVTRGWSTMQSWHTTFATKTRRRSTRIWAAILGTEEACTPSGFFALAFDVSKAHRRVPIAVEDWGLQAGEVQEYIKDCDPVWLNTVGTYGIGSASYHWNRFGALMVRILIGVVGLRGSALGVAVRR